MKQAVEKITFRGKLLALIVHPTTLPPGAYFVSPADAPLQIGTLVKSKGERVRPHMHTKPTKPVKETQEILIIEKGKMKMFIYAPNGKFVHEEIIESGDKVLLAAGGHGFEVLEDTVFFHIKQGPYPGPEKAKKYLKP